MKALLRTTGMALALAALAATPLAAEELLGEVNGELGASGFQTEDGFYLESFEDWYDADVEYRATVETRDFNPAILLVDPKADFEIIAVAETTDGRTAELAFSVPRSGNYMIVVTSTKPDQMGQFEIALAAE